MYCRNCGAKANEKAQFCIKCGCGLNNGTNHCQNCGVETSEKQELCVSCGIKLAKYIQPNKINAIFDGNGTENYNFSILDEYYQYEFNKIKDNEVFYKGKFNWPAFLFGPLWMLSKGMFVPALIWLILSFIISYFTLGIGSIITCVIAGMRGNYLYYNYYTKNQIKMF